ncbi:MAG TPA: hypothetical protein VLK84_08040, partial [Longimicrobium sp.]|nr:hypothetical protein [Longimicrobium sp.]
MSDWFYGRLTAASAVLANGRLTVRVDGEHPGRHFDVKLAEYTREARRGAPVRLGLYWRTCSDEDDGVPTRYTVRADVPLRGPRPATIRVDHASGVLDLWVRHAIPGRRFRIGGTQRKDEES